MSEFKESEEIPNLTKIVLLIISSFQRHLVEVTKF